MHTTRFIFEKDGGLILQLDNQYARRYSDMRQAAVALHSYLDDETNLARWDHHNPKLLKLRPKYQQLLAGVFQIYTFEELLATAIALDAFPNQGQKKIWPQVNEFCFHLLEVSGRLAKT